MNEVIMVVDDDVSLLTLLEIRLRRQGFSVMKARSGHAALASLKSGIPDLFIIDVMMPNMDGFELCERLRSRTETREIPIIILSAKDDSRSVRRGIEAGANLFASKTEMHYNLLSHVRDLLAQEI